MVAQSLAAKARALAGCAIADVARYVSLRPGAQLGIVGDEMCCVSTRFARGAPSRPRFRLVVAWRWPSGPAVAYRAPPSAGPLPGGQPNLCAAPKFSCDQLDLLPVELISSPDRWKTRLGPITGMCRGDRRSLATGRTLRGQRAWVGGFEDLLSTSTARLNRSPDRPCASIKGSSQSIVERIALPPPRLASPAGVA